MTRPSSAFPMDSRLSSPFTTAPSFSAGPWGRRDQALILEDNDGIAGLLTLLLGKAGLKVIWCQSGQDALAQFALHGESIAVVLADCRLPDGDGRAFCQQLRTHRPELPLLLSSGSAAYLNRGPLQSVRLVRFLPKPYTPREVLAHVERLRLEAAQTLPAISAGFV